jgi:hypothetical protein
MESYLLFTKKTIKNVFELFVLFDQASLSGMHFIGLQARVSQINDFFGHLTFYNINN